ncbi:MAG: hypothetical protein RBR28_00770 [Lentimicrobium sp.]|jgi:uncharacterized BrkB/YihY/UPF0761 family membrane protein|nr:hypothetical protein [Lentimicrobium sp.]
MENFEVTPVPKISIGDWMITLLISAIPIVNIIMLFVWAFGSNTNPNKSNWAKAALIWLLIGIVLWVVLIVIFGASFMSFMNNQPDYINGY